MLDIPGFTASIFQSQPEGITHKILEVFHHQAVNVPVYHTFLQYLDKDPAQVQSVLDIPFLPISAYKTHAVIGGHQQPALIFESSGTTGMQVSRHHVSNPDLYRQSFVQGFRMRYGDPAQYCILALLPSYLERQNSSLVYMCQGLMDISGHPMNGFFLTNMAEMAQRMQVLRDSGTPTIVIGVSFALLDLAAGFAMPFPELILMETGGMKGKREEITRDRLHDQLKEAFGVHQVHSEYGMTELLSQAYASADGLFQPPPWMSVLVRDPEDPFTYLEPGKTGCLNIIDLANVHSCSFIATDDLGRLSPDGGFEVLGRFDHSDIRGCNLLTL